MSEQTRIKQKMLIGNATFQVIKNKGIERTTVRKVAKQAGLSLGTVQYYFPTQQDMYLYAMEMLTEKLTEKIKYKVQKEMKSFDDVLMNLSRFISTKLIEKEVWLGLSLMALRDPLLKKLSDDTYQSTKAFMKHLLEVLEQNHLFKNTLDLNREAENLHVFIDGLVVQSTLHPELFNTKLIEEKIRNYLLEKCTV